MSIRALSLGGFPLIGPTPGGGRSYVTGLDGWGTRVVKRERTDRIDRAGSMSFTGLDAARKVTISGRIAYLDPVLADIERELLPGLLGAGTGRLVVTDDAGTRWVDVGMDDADPEPKTPELVDFTFVVTADYPHKRALEPHLVPIDPGQSASVTNAGTASARVSVKALNTGTLRLRQNASGAVMRSRISVPSGTVFDAAERTVTSPAGLDIYDVMASPSEWLEVPRESTVTVANQGTAPVLLTVYDTYS